MAKLSQSKKILEFLKATPDQRFNARQIAEAIVVAYPADYEEKRQNPRFANESAFIGQIVAEIGAQREQITKLDLTYSAKTNHVRDYIGTIQIGRLVRQNQI